MSWPKGVPSTGANRESESAAYMTGMRVNPALSPHLRNPLARDAQRTKVLEAQALPSMLTTTEAANWLGTTAAALAAMRDSQRGPAFLKIGNAVRYREDILEEYARGQQAEGTVDSTELAIAFGMSEQALIEASLTGSFIKGARDGRSRKYRRSHVLKFLAGA